MTALAAGAAAPPAPALRFGFSSRLVVRGVDLFLVLPLVLTTLNSAGSWGFIASPPIKLGVCVIAVIVAIALLLHGRTRPPSPALVGTVVLYEFVLLVTSLLRQLPVQRYTLLGEQLALSFAVIAWVCVRPSRVLGVLYTTSLIHLALAVIIPDRFLMDDGIYRLDGGSHPIQLGFEAGMVLVVSVVAAISTRSLRSRIAFILVAAFGVYITAQAFSRQSLIAVSVSAVVLTLVVPGAFRWVRAYLGTIGAAVLVAALGGAGIASLLGAEQLSDLSSATGRTTIWARVLDFLPDFGPLGYGYAALNDAVGPDHAVFAASFGENAENALLQVLLDGGFAGAVSWVLFLVVAARIVATSTGASRTMVFAVLPLFLSSILVSSGLSGEGLQWWWFLGVLVECASAGRLAAVARPLRSITA